MRWMLHVPTSARTLDKALECIYKQIVRITFDPGKDTINRAKHGVSLGRANDFDFRSAFFAVDNRSDYGEIRYLAIGFLDTRLFALIFTEDGEDLRAISLRRATKQERSLYAESY